MTDLRKYPALRLLIVSLLASGFVFAFDLNLNEYIIISAALILAVLSLSIKRREPAYYILAVAFGLLVGLNAENSRPQAINKFIPEETAIVQGKVEKIFKKTNRYCRCLIRGRVNSKSLSPIENEGVLLTIMSLDDRPIDIIPGAGIYAEAYVRPPKNAQLNSDFPERQYLASLDAAWIARASAKKSAAISPPSGFYYIRHSITSEIQEKAKALFPEETRGIAIALLTGNKSEISYETKRKFALSGTAHVLAVSGLHVGIIASIIFLSLGFLKNRVVKFVLFSALVGGFVFITGFQASAMRAGIMAVLILFAYTFERRVNFINIVALAVLAFLAISPNMIYSVGFQMSFAAILGIALMLKPISDFFHSIVKSKNAIVKYLIVSVSLTLSASIIISPLIAYYFHTFSIVSPLANIFVIPLMTLGMIFTLVSLILSFAYLPLAELYSAASDAMFSWGIKVNEIAIDLPFAYLEGSDLTLIAALFSLTAIYAFLSKDAKTFAFRVTASAIAISLILNLQTDAEKPVKIIPRERYVATIVKINDEKNFAFLFDRKPKQYPSRDIGMEKLLENLEGDLTIFYSGNAGLGIVDRLKKRITIKSYSMSHKTQKDITRLLKIDEKIYRLIKF